MKHKLENWLFNGYVREPIPVFILTVMLGIVCLVFAVMSTWEYAQLDESNIPAGKLECVITGYEHEKGSPSYVLKTDDNITVDIPVRAIRDFKIIERLIEEQSIVFIEHNTPYDEEILKTDAVSITDSEGMPVITRDTILEARKAAGRKVQAILWGVCLCYWTLWGISYCILCNAPKYPRLASILIRKEYRYF